MNELIEFLTSKEIIVVYIVAAVACLLCFVIYLVDKNYYKRNQRHNTKELNKLVEQVNEIIENEYEEETTEVYDTPVLEALTPEENPSYTAKVQPLVADVEIKEVPTPVVEEVEQLEEETLNVEDIVLSTMPELVVEEPIVVETKEEVIAPKIEEKPVVEEELTYTSIEPDRQQAQEELMRLTEELEKAEQEQKNIDLTAYEEEQEENAIISLEELVRKSKEMYESNELTQYADEGNEPISLEDLEKRMNRVQEEIIAIEEEQPALTDIIDRLEQEIDNPLLEETTAPQQMVLDDFNSIKVTPEIIEETVELVEPVIEEVKEPVKPAYQAYQTTKKFERSPVISPIYGIERKEPTEAELELENTANYEKLDEEIKKTNEFLMTLKELQKNLD